jgi:PPOX class probable FMN-dependent enzyme
MTTKITTIAQLEALYGLPGDTSLVKEIVYINDDYRRMIEASPFAALATVGPEGLDCSPRGDRAGELVRIVDEKTLMMPDRRGNNRADSLKNIIRDPRVALMFLIPGSGNALRINGQADLDCDSALCASFAVDGQSPRSVIIIRVDAIYFQCARAIVRSDLWNPDRHCDPKVLPTAGQILATLSKGQIGGSDYDKEWPTRAASTMW